ncbi:MAG TPA: PAS domain-containing protein, partial [Coxiellaceae bacterium]|nr:PAS domain-containing protein [Coxiellaceae bacterium]
MAAFQDLNTLFSNLERPFLILNNDNIEYMNSAAKQALHIQNQNFQQQDFFKFCLSMQIDLTPSSQELKSGHYFVSNINGTATRWDIQALSNKPNQNHFLLLGSETTFTSDSLIDLFDIIYNIPSSIYWKDTQGRYLGCNASTLEIIDFATEKELIGKTDHDIAKIKDWPSSLVEQIKATDDQVIQSKKPIFNIEEGPFKTKNNSNLYQLTTKIPLFDKETKVIGILGTSIDITEIKQSHVASNKIDLEFLDKLNKRIMGPAAKTYDSVQEYVENLYLYLDNIIYNMPGSVYWKDVNGV